jgi:hypothetical protein
MGDWVPSALEPAPLVSAPFIDAVDFGPNHLTISAD